MDGGRVGGVMKWIDELDGEFNGKPCKIKVGVSANDIMNDSIPSIRDGVTNELIEKREMNLLYHCRYQLADIIKMIDVANTTDDLNLELLKVLVGDIKKVVDDNL